LRPQRTNVSAAEEDDRRASEDHSRPRGVTLSGRDVEDAKRLLALLADQEPNAGGSALPRSLYQSIQDQHAQLVKQASRILALRRRRAKQFGKAMFSEPAWEMLLLLYATQHAYGDPAGVAIWRVEGDGAPLDRILGHSKVGYAKRSSDR
jgi:hypothetical protein